MLASSQKMKIKKHKSETIWMAPWFSLLFGGKYAKLLFFFHECDLTFNNYDFINSYHSLQKVAVTTSIDYSVPRTGGRRKMSHLGF